jgi:hypothetical protein
MVLIMCLSSLLGCGSASQAPPADASAARADSERSPVASNKTLPKCVPASDLPTPPRKIRDRTVDLADLQSKTHAGVLVFEAVIAPSGAVTDFRLVKGADLEYPWPTIAERWQSAIAEWRYQPLLLNNKPVAVCTTISIIVHAM